MWFEKAIMKNYIKEKLEQYTDGEVEVKLDRWHWCHRLEKGLRLENRNCKGKFFQEVGE